MEKTTEVEIIIFHVPLYNYSRLSEYNLSPMNGALISNKWRLVRYEEKTPICRPSTFQYSASFATGLAPIGERATLCRERFVSIPQDHHKPLPRALQLCILFSSTSRLHFEYVSSPIRATPTRFPRRIHSSSRRSPCHERDGGGGTGIQRGFSRFSDRDTVPIPKIPSKGILSIDSTSDNFDDFVLVTFIRIV